MRDDLQTSAPDAATPGDDPASASCALRILATTDVHMQMLGFDYTRNRPGHHGGLASLATLIRRARSEAELNGMDCLLLDNGDFLQGAALGRTLAQMPVGPDHPVVACLSRLGYDALGLGNHDLDHGLAYLDALAEQLPMPVIASNLARSGQSPLRRHALVDRGGPRIGIVSVLPETTAIWNRSALQGHALVSPLVSSTERAVASVRAEGADIVILLAHLGLEDHACGNPDDARRLMDLPGIDAIILGHTHRRLPGRDHAGLTEVDTRRGRLGQRPSAMAGHDASDLAVLDLQLIRTPSGDWRVASHQSSLRANDGDVPPDAEITALCQPAHRRTRKALARPCGRTDRPLHNFFSLAAPTGTAALVAAAKRRTIAQALAGTMHAGLPVLSAAPAHTAGGRGGPDHFLHVPPGAVFRRHLAALDPYGDAVWGLRITGAELRTWLENKAGVFSELRQDDPDQPLLQAARPAFDFDTIFGLTYGIDPSRPAGARITDLKIGGTAITDEASFALATSDFRAAGGGGGAQFGSDRVICRGSGDLVTALEELLAEPDWMDALAETPWRFACASPVQAVLHTAPGALDHLEDIAHLDPQPLGIDPRGFALLRLTL